MSSLLLRELTVFLGKHFFVSCGGRCSILDLVTGGPLQIVVHLKAHGITIGELRNIAWVGGFVLEAVLFGRLKSDQIGICWDCETEELQTAQETLGAKLQLL